MRGPRSQFCGVVVAALVIGCSLSACRAKSRDVVGAGALPPGAPPPGAPLPGAPLPEALPPDVPPFPWPPPAASAATNLTRQLTTHHEFAKLGDADDVLQAALQSTGYADTSYYGVPGGFALVTRLEHIDANGASRPETDRWLVEAEPLRRFSLRDYLRALFTADPGHYRIIVFIVTDAPVNQGEQRIAENDALTWLREGRQGLPQALAARPWTPDMTCTALIYEFVHEQQQDPQVVVPGALGGLTHLSRAGTRTTSLWAALEL